MKAEATATGQFAITDALRALAAGDDAAMHRLLPMVYDQLHALAAAHLRHEHPGHTLQPTALVHEAYLKLVGQKRVNWLGRSHFFAVGAQAMRRILVDHARGKQRNKRGGGQTRVLLQDELVEDKVRLSREREADVLAVDEALHRLEQLDPRQARIVEMRFFGGLSVKEVAGVLGVSKRTVEAEWTMIRAWLRRELGSEEAS